MAGKRKEKTSMTTKDLLQAALDFLEWKDEIEHDESDDTDFMRTQYGINDQAYDMLVVTSDVQETIKILMRCPIRIPAARMTEAASVINVLNVRTEYGNVEINDGAVFFRWGMRLRGTNPTHEPVLALMSAASNFFDEIRVAAIGALAFTKQSADEIIHAYHEAADGRVGPQAEAAAED